MRKMRELQAEPESELADLIRRFQEEVDRSERISEGLRHDYEAEFTKNVALQAENAQLREALAHLFWITHKCMKCKVTRNKLVATRKLLAEKGSK